MITLPITKQAQEQERDKILTITQNSRFTKHTIHNLRKKLSDNNKKKPLGDKQQITQGEDKKWITFTYRSPLIRKVTNLFKQTNLNIAFKFTNTIYQQLSHNSDNTKPSEIYEIKCNTSDMVYIGQSVRPIITRHREHM